MTDDFSALASYGAAPEPNFFESARDYIFGKPLTPEEQVKLWKTHLIEQRRMLDRQLRGIEREEGKAKKQVQLLAKKGDMDNAKVLTKEIIRTRKQVERIHTSKAQINSVIMQLQQNLATYKVAGAIKKNTEIMKMINSMTKVPELKQTMMVMAQEMQKAGLIDEIIDEAIGGLDDDSLSEEVDEAVSKIFDELHLNFTEKVPSVEKGTLIEELPSVGNKVGVKM